MFSRTPHGIVLPVAASSSFTAGGLRMAPRLSGVFAEIDPQVLDHPVLRFFKDYWDLKRDGRLMPSRADLRPSEMKEHLGWVILVDVLPDFTDFRYRTIGTRVSQYFFSDDTGKTVSEAFGRYGEAAARSAVAVFAKTARDRVPVRSYGDAGWIGRAFLDFDALYLPLSDDGETANMVLCAFTFDASELVKARSGDNLPG